MRACAVLVVASSVFAQTWTLQSSGTTASLRGLSAPSANVVWASGTNGTYLTTSDRGKTWRSDTVPGAEQLDFRDIHALDARTATLLSSGPGDKSRIYKTTDSGRHWTLQFTNPDALGFFDAIAFWDARHGIVLGDPVAGEFTIFTTDDAGETWQRRHTPPSLAKEGAFAASGTCLIVTGRNDVWFATGGPGGARVFHSSNRGRTWTVAATPIRNDAATAGIFSLAFRDSRHGIAVGGDYSKPADSTRNIAVTSDGGRTWTEPRGAHPSGYRSAVAFVPRMRAWIAVGTSGSDLSRDDGATWKSFDAGAYNAIAVAPNGSVWAVGPQGRLAELH